MAIIDCATIFFVVLVLLLILRGNQFVACKAVSKGYKYWCWFLQSWIGVNILVFTPDATKVDLSPDRCAAMQSSWSLVGITIWCLELMSTLLVI